MYMTHGRHTVIGAGFLTVLLAFAPSAAAQFFGQPSDLPVGEFYHVEFMAGMWNPTPQLTISSEAFGIAGTDIDFTTDLGIAPQRFGEVRLRLRPGRKHRFRLDYVPIRYSAESVLNRRLVFRGVAYNVGIPVSSTITWNTWRLGYEYDFIHRSRGYLGFIVEAKFTEIAASLDTAFGREFARARAPIPAIGAVVRVYPLRVLGITAEFTGFKLPEGLDENYRGQYVDADIYGTLNFTEQVGVQVGYRTLDLSYLFESDAVDMKLEGVYVAALVRF